MVVSLISWQLSLPECGSLKDKRQVVRSLKERLRKRFNVSVAETDHHDLRQRAEITAVLVTTEGRFAESVLSKLDDLVEAEPRAHITGTVREAL